MGEILLIEDKNDTEYLRQAQMQEQLKKVHQENEKKRTSKIKIAYTVASRLGKGIQKL